MNLKEAAQQALDALELGCTDHDGNPVDLVGPAITALRAALAEDAMKRLTDEQQMIERGTKAWAGVPDATAWVEDLRGNEPVTDCHGLEQARAAATSNLLAHFGITSADSNVNVAYLHKQLDDFLTAAIGCSKGGDKLTRPLKKVEECEYPRCLSSSGCERQCPAFPHCDEDHLRDATKMMATSQESRQVEPVAYVTGYFGGRCVIRPVEAVLFPVGIALYRSPPTIDEMETVEPVAWMHEFEGVATLNMTPPKYYGDHWKHTALYAAPPKRNPLTAPQIHELDWPDNLAFEDILEFTRAIERAHGIGG